MRWSDFTLDLQDAWRDIRCRPFRSMLSAIGISVGVLSLVAMMSITSGARETALVAAESLGLDKIRIERGASEVSGRSIGLSLGDVAAVSRESGVDVQVAYYDRRRTVRVQANDVEVQAPLFAVSDLFFALEELTFARGLPWPEGAAPDRCVIGAELARGLAAAPGEMLVVVDFVCPVAGVLEAHPALVTEGTGLSAIEFDNSVFLPFGMLHGRFPDAPLTGLVVRVGRDENFARAVTAVTSELTKAHAGQRDFVVVVPMALADQVDDTQRLFTLIMSAIAGLALLVGGIGIANSLLATVAEQTREIGLRMAVGATAERVLSLYVLHALCLCGAGAVVGSVLGLLLAVTVQSFAGWQVSLSLTSVLVGVTFALITGALSASYPALRAARMSAAVALLDH